MWKIIFLSSWKIIFCEKKAEINALFNDGFINLYLISFISTIMTCLTETYIFDQVK